MLLFAHTRDAGDDALPFISKPGLAPTILQPGTRECQTKRTLLHDSERVVLKSFFKKDCSPSSCQWHHTAIPFQPTNTVRIRSIVHSALHGHRHTPQKTLRTEGKDFGLILLQCEKEGNDELHPTRKRHVKCYSSPGFTAQSLRSSIKVEIKHYQWSDCQLISTAGLSLTFKPNLQ